MVLAIASTIIITILAILAIILYSKFNRWIIIVLIPLVLISSISMWKLIEYNLGKPITGIPENSVTVLMLRIEKPNIMFVVREGNVNRFYQLPYTDQNAEIFDNIRQRMERNRDGMQDNPIRAEFYLDADNNLQYSLTYPFPVFEKTPAE